MRTLFYSTKEFEIKYLQAANQNKQDIVFTSEPLSRQTAGMAYGFEAVSIFAGDDASAPVLEKLSQYGIRFIAIRSAGYDNVDLEKALALGLTVANVPEYSPYAIAEHVVALIQAMNRKIVLADKQVHGQDFTVSRLVGFDLNGKTIGIIGVGRIGAVLVKIMNGFGCRVLGCDIEENKELTRKYGLQYTDILTLCREADIISVNTPLLPSTSYLIDKKLIGLMKRGVMIINTSRGACVKTADIIKGLEEGHIGYYGADVYEKEKGVFFYDRRGDQLNDAMLSTLMTMSNVLITPHSAFATTEALSNIAGTTFYNLQCFKENKESKNQLHGSNCYHNI